MAEMKKNRLGRKVSKPQQIRKGGAPPVSPVRRVAIAVGILLVVVVAVIAVMKYAGKKRTAGIAPGTTAGVAAQADSPATAAQEGRTAVLTSVAIVPPNPTSSTPLNVAYVASSSGGGSLAVMYRWYVDGTLVQDGPSNTLLPGTYRKGASVYAEVQIEGQTAGSSGITTPAVAIGNGQPEVTMVTLGPDNAVVGATLSATPAGTDPDGDPLSYTYQWRVNGNAVGAPGGESTFSTAGLKKRDSVSVLVSCTDGAAAGSPIASNTVSLQNQGPKITSTAPLQLSGGFYVYQVAAKDPDGDPLTYRLDRFPAGMSIDAASGLIRWELPRGVIFTGRNDIAVAVIVSDGDGASDSQEFTLVITDAMIN